MGLQDQAKKVAEIRAALADRGHSFIGFRMAMLIVGALGGFFVFKQGLAYVPKDMLSIITTTPSPYEELGMPEAPPDITTTTTEVKDKAGQLATLITIVARDYHWKRTSAEGVQYQNKVRSLREYVSMPAIRQYIEQSGFDAIVGVGAASNELVAGGTSLDEQFRAMARADRIQNEIREMLPALKVKYFALSLGRNSKKPASLVDSDAQRRVVILGIKGGKGVDFGSILSSQVLEKVDAFPFVLSEYAGGAVIDKGEAKASKFSFCILACK